VYPPIVTRQRFGKNATAVTNTHATIEECWTCRCPCGLYVWYQRKQTISSSQNFLFHSAPHSHRTRPSTSKEDAGAVRRYREHKPNQCNTYVTNALCRLAKRSHATLPHRSVQPPAVNSFYAEDEDSVFLRNVGKYLPDYTVSHLKPRTR
jgi:hypothetical protein